MSSNKVINHNTYAEITNGLFFVKEIIFGVSTDDPEEFTFRQGIQIVPRGITEIINQLEPPQEFVPLTRQQREVERARIENERLSLQLRNMSEQQLLEHFDRISQEE